MHMLGICIVRGAMCVCVCMLCMHVYVHVCVCVCVYVCGCMCVLICQHCAYYFLCSGVSEDELHSFSTD